MNTENCIADRVKSCWSRVSNALECGFRICILLSCQSISSISGSIAFLGRHRTRVMYNYSPLCDSENSWDSSEDDETYRYISHQSNPYTSTHYNIITMEAIWWYSLLFLYLELSNSVAVWIFIVDSMKFAPSLQISRYKLEQDDMLTGD